MSDAGRASAVVVAAVLQIGAGVVGGAGLWGESVGVVANSYPTLLLPGGAAFAIWSLIYVTFAAHAVRQSLPNQRVRPVHRRTGWWLAAAGGLNAAWVALFAHRFVVAAQLVIVALLVCLCVAAVRLREPARGWGDRLFSYVPIALYLGWVAVATVAGVATTTASFGVVPTVVGAVTALLGTGVVAAVAATRLPAAFGFAAAVCWALVWVAVRTPVASVKAAALVAAFAVVVAVVVRLGRAGDRRLAGWG